MFALNNIITSLSQPTKYSLKIWLEIYVKELLILTWKLILQFYATLVIKKYLGIHTGLLVIKHPSLLSGLFSGGEKKKRCQSSLPPITHFSPLIIRNKIINIKTPNIRVFL
jgi:hypothetical protein